jgi:hypothetical protein
LEARSVVPITEAPIREPAIGHFGAGFEGDGFGIPGGHVKVLEVSLAIFAGV